MGKWAGRLGFNMALENILHDHMQNIFGVTHPSTHGRTKNGAVLKYLSPQNAEIKYVPL
jgi:hypothetical protein